MTPTWDISLERPPEVVAIGRHAHGFEETDRYCLPDLWSLHLYGYEASLDIEGTKISIMPGYAGVIPPGKSVEYRYVGVSVHIFVHFRITSLTLQSHKIVAMQDLGDRYENQYQRLYEVIGSFGTDPSRVNARVWDLLWDLASHTTQPLLPPDLHPAVKKATEIIARNLNTPIVIESLANEVGVSYSYLAKLFQQSFGLTVIAYIQARRLERAIHLLERSTLPVKAVAFSVGFSDLHHFNKSIRNRYGASPRKIREAFLETGQSQELMDALIIKS